MNFLFDLGQIKPKIGAFVNWNCVVMHANSTIKGIIN